MVSTLWAILRAGSSPRTLPRVGEHPSDELEWSDATEILAALMRIDTRLDELEAKLETIERLLDDNDEEEEESDD